MAGKQGVRGARRRGGVVEEGGGRRRTWVNMAPAGPPVGGGGGEGQPGPITLIAVGTNKGKIQWRGL